MDGSLRVLDVQEKEVGAVQAPSFPTPRSSASGFPQPKKRARFVSAFKQQRQAAVAAAAAEMGAAPSSDASRGAANRPPHGTDDKATIDRENRERLQSMAPGEIEAARQELLANLDPELLQILLRRANLDDASNAQSLPGDPPPQPEAQAQAEQATARTAKPKKSVAFASTVEDADDDGEAAQPTNTTGDGGDNALFPDDQAVPPPGRLAPISSPGKAIHDHDDGHDHGHGHDHNHDHENDRSTVHFPQPPTVPDLDPDDPDFLQNLHAKYFPNLPADPARLAWMAPLPTADSPADRESPYYPGQASLAVSQLRFDFRGRLVPPRTSRAIPVSRGLHHHGVAPEAAGYTVGELARLARSAVPAQRCVAFQTLGRVLYRLGRGEWGGAFGDGAAGRGSAVNEVTSDPRVQLAQGIWQSLSEGRVLDTLREAAGVEEGQGHRGSRAYAIEAIWLYEKGGWKERWMGR